MNKEIFNLAKLHNWNLPTTCPVCGGDLILSENHKQLSCGNDFCKSKYSGRIGKWVGVLGIKEFGLTTIEKLFDAGIIDTVSSLYKIDYSKIEALEGFGPRSCEIFKKELDSHKKVSLSHFIAAYNIDSIGEKVVDKIMKANGLKTLDDFIFAKSSNVFVCQGVGPITAEKLFYGLQALRDDMIETTKFVQIKEEVVQVSSSNSLAGKSFCFTGNASRPRKELFKMVTDNGGIIHDGIKKNPLTDYLVIADVNSTSSKAVAARKLGVKLISEDEFVGMC